MTARREAQASPGLTALLFCLSVALAALALAAVAAPPGRAAVSGDLLAWAPLYVGATTERDALFSAALGPDGSVCVCGASDQSEAHGRMYVAKYGADSVLQWQVAYRPPATVSASASHVAVDASGGVVVAGQAWDGTQNSMAVVKFSATGVPLWSALRTGAGTFDGAGGLAVGSDGSVYLAQTGWGEAQAFVVKYDADADPARPGRGLELWEHPLTGAGSSPSVSEYALALDSSGNVYVAGDLSSATGKLDAFVLKLSPSGARRWLRTWDGALHGSDTVGHLAIRGRLVYAAGNTETKRRRADVVTLSYDTAGHLRWVRTWDDGSRQNDNVGGLRTDRDGNAYGVNDVWLSGDRQKIVLCKYAPSGKLLWQKSYRGLSGEGGANAGGLAVGPAGDAYVSGYLSRPAGLTQFLTVKWSASGARRWARAWSGPPVQPLGGQAWACILSGTSVVALGEAFTAASGSGAEVTWRRR